MAKSHLWDNWSDFDEEDDWLVLVANTKWHNESTSTHGTTKDVVADSDLQSKQFNNNDPDCPDQHTTTTSMSQTTVSPEVRFDSSYLRTIPGIVKVVCIVLDLLGFICIEVSVFSYHSRGSYFNTVAMLGFWFTGILLFFYLFHVCEKFYKVPWLKIEFGFNATWTILYLIAASLAASMGVEKFTDAAFFGFCAMVAYGFDAFLKFNAMQAGEIDQGSRLEEQHQTNATIA